MLEIFWIIIRYYQLRDNGIKISHFFVRSNYVRGTYFETTWKVYYRMDLHSHRRVNEENENCR